VVVHGVTDAGLVREHNEDQFLIAELERTLRIVQCGYPDNDGRTLVDDIPALFMLVADGMGGHEHGEVASAVVTDVMANYAFSMMPWLGAADVGDGSIENALGAGLTRAVEESQQRMEEVAERKGLRPQMGSTLTLGYVVWPRLYLVHVGDSRAYLYRDDELYRLTRDHNVAEQMVQEGLITEEDAKKSAWSSVLTNAVGGGQTTLEAELHQVALEEKDVLLLCSDGLYGMVDDDSITRTLSACTSGTFVAPCARRLVEAAKKAGAEDNVTVVLARF
jgi:protein phosphatase